MSDTECPTCGQDDFASRQGVKTHHTRTHGESLPHGESVECEYCGAIERKYPSRIDRQEKHFCGNDCQGKWMEEQSAEKSPAWNGGKVEVECSWCGDVKKIRRAHAEKTDNNFCSHTCLGEWMSEHNTGESHPNWSGMSVECRHCGESTRVFPYELDRYENHFCDNECYTSWASEAGEDHPLYRGGTPPYGPGFNEAKKEAVRERDGRECVLCGRSEEDHTKQYGRKHHIHHIVKARRFDDGDPAKDGMDNLLTVCVGKCHTKVERMSPLRPVV